MSPINPKALDPGRFRRTIDVLDSENQPGSRDLGSDTKSMKTKKKGFKNYLKYSSNLKKRSILKVYWMNILDIF